MNLDRNELALLWLSMRERVNVLQREASDMTRNDTMRQIAAKQAYENLTLLCKLEATIKEAA